MTLTGWYASWKPVPIDESRVKASRVEDVPGNLARMKAEAARGTGSVDLILAADTVVIDDGDILGKPATEAEALQMLRRLRGRTHRVVTAVALFSSAAHEMNIENCETSVTMRAYGERELLDYVRGGSPMDKAGAYGIQDERFSPVDAAKMSGCYANVMGLPLCHLARAMRRLGYEAPNNVPASCQNATGYTCPVYRSILRGDV